MVSHDGHSIREHCDRACVLRAGKVHDFPDIESAYDFYHAG